ncbi:MAG: hypothetical protein IJW19_02515 [Clostridia bacterium]|nr:hypothetical protein [Clostridia bacterium]
MRRLSITRTKSFVGCLCKTKIYIEDNTSTDLVIKGVGCRFLGEIKNGATETFEIGEESAKLFAIAGKTSKNYCNELYVLPEGSEDIALTGKHKYNPGAGNPFYFDNNNSGEAAVNRSANKNRGMIIMAIAIAIGIVIGIFAPNIITSVQNKKPMDIEVDDMKMTLTKAFEEKEDDVGIYYASDDVAVYFIEEKFTDLGVHANGSAKNYAELALLANNIDTEVKEEDGLVYFVYTKTVKSKTFKYYSFSYKEDDAFWLIQFAVRENDAPEYEDRIFEWAKSVEFS